MSLVHVRSITDDVGIFEHCLGTEPRYAHGYCVDDVARAVVVLERLGDSEGEDLLHRYRSFLDQAQDPWGRMWNRRDTSGSWQGEASTRDHWGRALWAWGTTVRASRDGDAAAHAYERFVTSARRRSPYPRSMCFAALGAVEVLQVLPGNPVAIGLLEDAVRQLPIPTQRNWVWPEPRLTYANAVLPEVLMMGGVYLGESHLTRLGLAMLDWLVDLQTVAGHLSVIPHRGWGRGEALPAFDQQPIEVASLVDACATAYDITSDPQWSRRVMMGMRWFEGDNDGAVPMADPVRGAGFDGLTQDGRNENCGAESTLAYLSVLQRARTFTAVPA